MILVDAGATTIAENLGAIRRAKQVVAFGDPVTQTPTLFETGIDDAERSGAARRSTEHGVDALHADSALARLGELLPTLTLTRSYRAGGEDLAELVNRRFYAGRIVSLPWAGSFLGHGSLGLHYVAGNGLPDAVTGTVESDRLRGREGRRARHGARGQAAARVAHGDHREHAARRTRAPGGARRVREAHRPLGLHPEGPRRAVHGAHARAGRRAEP